MRYTLQNNRLSEHPHRHLAVLGDPKRAGREAGQLAAEQDAGDVRGVEAKTINAVLRHRQRRFASLQAA
jgi:hypothetical protein